MLSVGFRFSDTHCSASDADFKIPLGSIWEAMSRAFPVASIFLLKEVLFSNSSGKYTSIALMIDENIRETTSLLPEKSQGSNSAFIKRG